MTEARQETQVWTVNQVLNWLSGHLAEGHDVRLPRNDADEEDRSAGVFACSCGAQIEARPVVAYQPAPGLYAVTGAVPLERPAEPPVPPAALHTRASDAPDTPVTASRVVVTLHKAHRRVRLSIGAGACAELDHAQVHSLSRVILAAADELDRVPR